MTISSPETTNMVRTCVEIKLSLKPTKNKYKPITRLYVVSCCVVIVLEGRFRKEEGCH